MQAEPVNGKEFRIRDVRAHIEKMTQVVREQAAQKEEMKKAMAQGFAAQGYAPGYGVALPSQEDGGEGGHGTLDLTDPDNYYARFMRLQAMETAREDAAAGPALPEAGGETKDKRTGKGRKAQSSSQKGKPVPEKGKGGEAGRESSAREQDLPGSDMADAAAGREQDRAVQEQKKDPHTRKAEKSRALRHDPKARAENAVNAAKEDVGQRLEEKIEQKAMLDALVFQSLMRQSFEGRELDLDAAKQEAEQEIKQRENARSSKKPEDKTDMRTQEKDAQKGQQITAELSPKGLAPEEVKSRTPEIRQDEYDEKKNTVADRLVVGQDLARVPESTLDGQTPRSMQSPEKQNVQQAQAETRRENREVVQTQPPLPKEAPSDALGRRTERAEDLSMTTGTGRLASSGREALTAAALGSREGPMNRQAHDALPPHMQQNTRQEQMETNRDGRMRPNEQPSAERKNHSRDTDALRNDRAGRAEGRAEPLRAPESVLTGTRAQNMPGAAKAPENALQAPQSALQKPPVQEATRTPARNAQEEAFIAGVRTGFTASVLASGTRELPTKDLMKQLAAGREHSEAETAARSIATFTQASGRPVAMNVLGHELKFAKDIRSNSTFAYIDGKQASLRDAAKFITAASKVNPVIVPSSILKQMTLAKADPFQRGTMAPVKGAGRAADVKKHTTRAAGMVQGH